MIGLKFDDVRSLEGGIDAWHGPVASGAYDHGFFLLGDTPTTAQALGFALSLEEGSRVFYAGIRDRMAGADRELLDGLVLAEERHAALLRDCAARLGVAPSPAPGDGTGGERAADWLEGVIRVDRALAWAGAPGRAAADILDLAMQVEANSLDLYLKLSRRADMAPVRAPLEKLIAEEKTHLAGLGTRLGALPT